MRRGFVPYYTVMIRAFVSDPFVWLALLGWVMSGVVYALPEPTEKSSPIYVFAFKALHFLGANVDKLKLPRK